MVTTEHACSCQRPLWYRDDFLLGVLNFKRLNFDRIPGRYSSISLRGGFNLFNPAIPLVSLGPNKTEAVFRANS